MSACRSASLSAPASLPLHGGCIKSADGVGSVDSALPQPDRLIIKSTNSTIRILDIFHHVAGYGSVDNPALGAGLRRFLLNGLDSFLGLVFLFGGQGVDMVCMSTSAGTPADQARQTAKHGTKKNHVANLH